MATSTWRFDFCELFNKAFIDWDF